MVDVDNIVVEVLGHIFFVLFKCNRVTNQALLGFAGLLAVGLPSHNQQYLFVLSQIFFLLLSTWGCVRLWLGLHLWDSAGQNGSDWSSCARHLPLSRRVPLSSSWVAASYIKDLCFAGLGIDDMFALVTTLQNLTELEMMLPREEKVGLVGDHYHFNLLTRLSGDEACWCRHHHHHFDRPGCLRHWSLLQSLFCQVSELCSISF